MATGNVDETEDGRADRGGVTMVSVFFLLHWFLLLLFPNGKGIGVGE